MHLEDPTKCRAQQVSASDPRLQSQFCTSPGRPARKKRVLSFIPCGHPSAESESVTYRNIGQWVAQQFLQAGTFCGQIDRAGWNGSIEQQIVASGKIDEPANPRSSSRIDELGTGGIDRSSTRGLRTRYRHSGPEQRNADYSRRQSHTPYYEGRMNMHDDLISVAPLASTCLLILASGARSLRRFCSL
jgi:hypothetical protein